MNKALVIDTLLDYFISENSQFDKSIIPDDYYGKKRLLRALMNVRESKPLEDSTLKLLNAFLKNEREEEGIVDPYKLSTVFDKFQMTSEKQSKNLVLWHGDITTIAADAIVNAANSKMRGCFIPLHNCIDNAIHSAAGIELRLECDMLMRQQDFDEPTGQAQITRAYNLPSKYVLHTVGPIIHGDVSETDRVLLKSCYTSCLEKAAEYDDIKTIAFCCISTGEFRFPKSIASKIAVETVCDWLERYPNKFDRIIFNVFSEEDYNEYAKFFK